MIKEIEVDCAFVDQISEASEQANYYLNELNAEPTNEYYAQKFCVYHSIVESLKVLESIAAKEEAELLKNF
jgi:hypothetical protein